MSEPPLACADSTLNTTLRVAIARMPRSDRCRGGPVWPPEIFRRTDRRVMCVLLSLRPTRGRSRPGTVWESESARDRHTEVHGAALAHLDQRAAGIEIEQ